ncbi:MAG: orotate phosphoribosyltransferase [Nitrospinae bacterium]|nr:orotate phosphoribosyltransferase [Nitrospinota bacterium]MZH15421.1 orotate phosphoribosyltransferase [Nitrospinota bacterium]
MSDSSNLSRMALESGAIQLNTEKPFTWASGYKMPIYNDNRLLLGKAEYRSYISQVFIKYIDSSMENPDVIAGTATAGIPHATTLADSLKKPLIYVRSTAKSHGMGNQIEGPLTAGQKVLLIEDLISTGGSAINAVNAIRKSGGIADHCLCIFSYGFPEAQRGFEEIGCQFRPILTFLELLEEAKSMQMLSNEQIESLHAWHKAPFKWAQTKGF